MTILRHSKIAVTMDIYSQVSSTSTKEALKRLGNQFGEAVGYALSPATAQQVPAIAGSPTASVQGQAYRNQVAAAPMLTVPADAASTPEIATVVGPAMTVPVATTVWNSERWNGPLVARPSEFLEVVRGSWRYGLGSVRGPLTTAAPTWTKTPDQILNRINRKRSNTTSH